MNKARYLILAFISALIGLAMTACISDDFSTSPDDRLTFSTDTVSFDTVFTGQGTPTARLLVFNHAKKAVNISSIRFARQDTEFSLNVDGMSGETFSDVEIRGGDSIYVFIECNLPESANKEPHLVSDRLQFVTNGVTQEVEVEAYGQNVTRLRGTVLTEDTYFNDSVPYVVTDSLIVEAGATLYAAPGTRLLFHDKAKLVVRGRIEAVGEPGRLVQLRGDRLDNVLPDVPYAILAGQWQGVNIASGSFDNRLEYVQMQSTVEGLTIESCALDDRTRLTLVNSWLHNSQGSVLTSRYARVNAYGVCFSEAANAVVSLTGGVHDFSQCTISNYYLFSGSGEPLLYLSHLYPDDRIGNSAPLMQADFGNCILYGMRSSINTSSLADTNVYLRYVLLKENGEDDDHFILCLWGKDPLFYTVREDYYFNYRLRPESPAIAAGNPTLVAAPTLTDIDGLPRLSAGAPDLGAYVYVAPAE